MIAWHDGISLAAVTPAWTGVLVDVGIKGLAVMAMAGVAAWALHRTSAATRHLVWLLATVSLLLLPVLSVALPGWQALPQWFDLAGDAIDQRAPVELTAGHPLADSFPTVHSPESTAGALAERPAAFASEASRESTLKPPAPSMGAVSPEGDSPAIDDSRGGGLWTWVLFVWAVGVAMIVGRLCLGRLSLLRVVRTSQPITEGAWGRSLRELAAELGLRPSVQLMQTDRRAMPMTWGVLRPRVLLPVEASDWSADRQRAVLLHELAHIRRRDCLALLISQLACAVHWFNPLAWMAARRMVSESERACDDLVLGAGSQASDYAEHLLQVASGMKASALTSVAAIAMARPSAMEGRLLAILDAKRNRRPVTSLAAIVGLAATACLLLPLATAQPAARAEERPKHGQKRKVTSVTGWKVALSSGVTVELLGVCEHPSKAKRWWRPDGSSLPDAPYEAAEHQTAQDDHAKTKAYEFAARVAGPGELSRGFDVSGAHSGGLSSGGLSWGDDRHGKRIPHLWAKTATIPAGQRTTTIRISVGAEPWETWVTHRNLTAMGSAYGRRSGGFLFSRAYMQGGQTVLTATHNMPELMDHDIRLVAVDKRGKQHPAVHTTMTGVEGMKGRTCKFDVHLDEIVEVQLQMRPWEHVEFADVSLQPGTRTKVNVLPRRDEGSMAGLNEGQRLYAQWTTQTFGNLVNQSKYREVSGSERGKLESQWLATLDRGKGAARLEAISRLAVIQSARAVRPLLTIAAERREKDNQDRWMAVRALGLIGDKSVVPELIHLIYHYNQNVRFWAQISLVRLTGENFADDWQQWGTWWTDQGGKPAFSPERITWTTRKKLADRETQKEGDRRMIEGLKRKMKSSSAPQSSSGSGSGSLSGRRVRGSGQGSTPEQTRPVVALLSAVRSGDIERFKAVFSKKMKTTFEKKGWDAVLESYRKLWMGELGDYAPADFTLSFAGDARTGKVGVKHKGKRLPSLSVLKEDGEWRINER